MEINIIDENRFKKLKKFESDNDLEFENIELLNNAFCHSSYVNELPSSMSGEVEDNERLEFLGDSVLTLIVNEYLFTEYPDYTEGQLSEVKAIIVSEFSLANVARSIDLGSYLLLGKGELAENIHSKDGILSDTVEAIIGAYYVDSGLEKVRDYVIPFVEKEIDNIAKDRHRKDYKSALQFYIQRKYKRCPVYKTVKEEGPEHNKLFYVEVVIEGKVCGRGEGYKKKLAQQEAAKEAMEKIKEDSTNDNANA